MRQLALPIRPALAYSPEGFVCHSGVVPVLTELAALGRRTDFAIRYIEGVRRSGKTHMSLKLHADLVDAGRLVVMVDGTAGRDSLRLGRGVTAGTAVLIDDADRLIDSLRPEDEGLFVTLVEQLRAAGGQIFLFGSKSVADLTTDDHVRSRLRTAAGVAIEAPGEDDIRPLLAALARQRGLQLKGRELAFLTKRLGRDIQSLEYYLERLQHLSQVLSQPIRFPLVANAV